MTFRVTLNHVNLMETIAFDFLWAQGVNLNKINAVNLDNSVTDNSFIEQYSRKRAPFKTLKIKYYSRC